jgi:hypothetical protein
MTTDLTGDFELGEEEFDWDVFLPDPDEAEIAAAAAALEDEAELDLDDSSFDWEAALREEGGPESDADNGARAGAAYDRIVNTVRQSFEDPEPEEETAVDAEAAAEPVLQSLEAVDVVPEAQEEVEEEPESFAPRLEIVAPSEAEPDHTSIEAAGFAPGDEYEVDDALAPETAPDMDPETDAEPESFPAWDSALPFVAATAAEPAAVFAPAPEWDRQFDTTFAAEPDVVPDPDPEPGQAAERFSTLAGPAAVTATVWTADPAADTPSEPELEWTTASTEQAEVTGEQAEVTGGVDSVPEPAAADIAAEEHDDQAGTEKRRSRVFTATIVLACLFLVVVAAAVGVRALRHQPTTAPPAHAASPASTARHTTAPSKGSTNKGSTSTASTNTARIQSATDAVDSAATAASVGLASLSAFPTPTNVETVINPYISSLQLYDAVLEGGQMPPAARPAAASAEAQLRQDLQFLDTIDGLPADQLGAYLTQFNADATRLQTTLSTLEQNLRASTS